MDPDPDPRKEIEVDPDLDPERELKLIRIRPNALDPGGSTSGSGSETLFKTHFLLPHFQNAIFCRQNCGQVLFGGLHRQVESKHSCTYRSRVIRATWLSVCGKEREGLARGCRRMDGG